MFFGVRPRFRKLGADAVLFLEVLEHAIRRGYETCEPSMLLEENDLVRRASEFMGGERYKTWRIYEMPLEPRERSGPAFRQSSGPDGDRRAQG